MSGGMRGWRRMLFLTCGCACSSTSRTCRRRILPAPGAARYADGKLDRKSTRLNSSHSQTPYAVLCLKKQMQSPTSTTDDAPPTMSAREAQRLETRARLFDAAAAEIARSGLAGADVSTIAAAVGVSRG